MTKDLTLNLGVAWDVTTPITEVANRMANYVPATAKLLVAGQNGVNNAAGINTNWTAFEPRIGLAWKVLGSDKTAVRAGFAIYNDSACSQGAQGLWQNPPFFAESIFFAPAGAPFAPSYAAPVLGETPTPLA